HLARMGKPYLEPDTFCELLAADFAGPKQSWIKGLPAFLEKDQLCRKYYKISLHELFKEIVLRDPRNAFLSPPHVEAYRQVLRELRITWGPFYQRSHQQPVGGSLLPVPREPPAWLK